MMTELTTDYLIIGAGALGMGFLDELIRNSEDLEAIIVDVRDKPGGHWNDAYSFVRLHQPALTYGLNSRELGVGGADLASKSQILAHYEMGLAALLATGRVRFLSQCRYVGDGKVVSLLDEAVSYQIKYRKKLVDATCCETIVPATSPPGFKVAPGVNFIPVNGLTGIRNSPKNYLVIGGGKTGIDAVLYLMDHGVDLTRLHWVVPNDAWFFNRWELDNNIYSILQTHLGSLFHEEDNTWQKVLLRFEKNGSLMRLDKNILPTRFRFATMTQAEVDKLKNVKNIIRKGRIASIDTERVKFESGEEMAMPEDTVVVDCARNSTKFPQDKKVFDGDKINLQFIMLPPAGTSLKITAGVELKFPNDEEKKNSICKPIDVAQVPEHFFTSTKQNNETQSAGINALGFGAIFNIRSNIFAHVGFIAKWRTLIWIIMNRSKIDRKIDMCIEQIEKEK